MNRNWEFGIGNLELGIGETVDQLIGWLVDWELGIWDWEFGEKADWLNEDWGRRLGSCLVRTLTPDASRYQIIFSRFSTSCLWALLIGISLPLINKPFSLILLILSILMI